MNYLFEEERHLNIKKVVIISIILIAIIIFIIVAIVKHISNSEETIPEQMEVSDTTSLYYSIDNTFSVELSNAFGLKPYNSDLGYLLELRSDDNLNIFISKEGTIPNRTLAEIVEADKIAYLENFESYSNLSDTKELSINDNPAYTYSFHYLDKNLNQAFYLQVTWLQINNEFYIFDIEFPLDDLSFNTNISSVLLSSFKIL